MQVWGEQWLTSDAPTVLTADLLWADRLAQDLKSSLIMIKKLFFMPWLKKKLFQLYLFCSQINVCMVHV